MSKSYAIIKLSDAITCAFPEVKHIFYVIDKESKEEHVICKYDICCQRGEFKICVTADSIPAMYDDVWNAIKKRFG